MNIEFLVSCGITVATIGCAWGVMKQKDKQHDEQIKEIKEFVSEQVKEINLKHSEDVRNLQQQINLQNTAFDTLKDGISELNTKMDLLLKGQLVIPRG